MRAGKGRKSQDTLLTVHNGEHFSCHCSPTVPSCGGDDGMSLQEIGYKGCERFRGLVFPLLI